MLTRLNNVNNNLGLDQENSGINFVGSMMKGKSMIELVDIIYISGMVHQDIHFIYSIEIIPNTILSKMLIG